MGWLVRAVTLGMVLLACGSADAVPLRQELEQMLEKHHLIQAAEADAQGAQASVGLARSVWFPKVNLGAQRGYEEYERDTTGSKSDLATHQESVSVSQMVWDFGAANATIDKAKEQQRQSEVRQEAQRQELILEGIGAYINYWLTGQILRHAEGLVANMVKQSELEQARIEIGQGYPADLVQVKSQLEGAKARKVEVEGRLRQAKHRYQALFGERNVAPSDLGTVLPPSAQLPQSLDEVFEGVMTSHPTLIMYRHAKAGARYEVDRVRASEWFPQVDVVGYENRYHNTDGSPGNVKSRVVELQVNWQFDLGLRASHSQEVAEMQARSLEERAADLETRLRENASNAWSGLAVARERAGYLRSQVTLAEEFVTLARKERELGRRSLLDVLNGETLLFSARSETISADVNLVLAAYQLLYAMGRLELMAVPGG